MINNDEIVTSVKAESDPVDDEMDEDEDNNESSKGPSSAGAFSALETAMECGTGFKPVTKQATVRYLYHSATAATRKSDKRDGTKEEVPCPKAVAVYNDVMGGVDRFDQR
ncbi:hypothetical protein TNCV_4198461 [Trichonephila clavipes]|nr:hypothetical protein TNCV_4198461 [Trichonephila clavipes]